ncbi:MAG: hypothetical protein AB7D06_02845 [Pedobacter sp.]
MRAKDWTMVVASESHMFFSISAPCHFASQAQFFPIIPQGGTPIFRPSEKLSKPWFFLISIIVLFVD